MGIYLYLINTNYWTFNKSIANNSEIKKYIFETKEEAMKLGQFFLDNVNDVCDCFVAPYDVDYLNASQCTKLQNWISNNNELIKIANLENVFEVINNYCSEAIKLDTGIEIDL